MSTRRRFSGDFKAKVALEALCGDKTIQEIAARHKIHPNQERQTRTDALPKSVQFSIAKVQVSVAIDNTFPSRLPDPRHLTVLARPVVVRAASTVTDVPRVGLPSASFSLLRQADGDGLSPPQGSRTPRGALYPPTTPDWVFRWPIP